MATIDDPKNPYNDFAGLTRENERLTIQLKQAREIIANAPLHHTYNWQPRAEPSHTLAECEACQWKERMQACLAANPRPQRKCLGAHNAEKPQLIGYQTGNGLMAMLTLGAHPNKDFLMVSVSMDAVGVGVSSMCGGSTMSERQPAIIEAATEMHRRWVAMINFHDGTGNEASRSVRCICCCFRPLDCCVRTLSKRDLKCPRRPQRSQIR